MWMQSHHKSLKGTTACRLCAAEAHTAEGPSLLTGGNRQAGQVPAEVCTGTQGSGTECAAGGTPAWHTKSHNVPTGTREGSVVH